MSYISHLHQCYFRLEANSLYIYSIAEGVKLRHNAHDSFYQKINIVIINKILYIGEVSGLFQAILLNYQLVFKGIFQSTPYKVHVPHS